MIVHTLQKIILVSGKDAEKFLQGQLTCDITQLQEGNPILGACCNVKGRVIATFRIRQSDTHFELTLPLETAPLLQTHFQKYSVFSKVEIAFSDLKEPCLDWRKNDIEIGFPNIFPATSELFTPHMLNLPKLGAVSFTKGCYLGQEIVARSEHLGKAKRHLEKVTINEQKFLQPGDTFYNSCNEAIGTVIDAHTNSNETILLAVIENTRV